MKFKLVVLFLLALTSLFVMACSDDDGADAPVPSNEEACANYESVCDGFSDAVSCDAIVNALEDCQKKCIGYGSDCMEIMECISTQSGELYRTYCEADSETPDGGDSLPEDSCLESSCGYEVDSCNGNSECVNLHYCMRDCDDCEDCDSGDCYDGCAGSYRTGTAQYGDLAECAYENGCTLY